MEMQLEFSLLASVHTKAFWRGKNVACAVKSERQQIDLQILMMPIYVDLHVLQLRQQPEFNARWRY
jgi:hypothetical protein